MVNPIPTKGGADYAHLIKTLPPGYSDLPTVKQTKFRIYAYHYFKGSSSVIFYEISTVCTAGLQDISTPDFSTPDFSTLNSSTMNLRAKKLMVKKFGVEKP